MSHTLTHTHTPSTSHTDTHPCCHQQGWCAPARICLQSWLAPPNGTKRVSSFSVALARSLSHTLLPLPCVPPHVIFTFVFLSPFFSSYYTYFLPFCLSLSILLYLSLSLWCNWWLAGSLNCPKKIYLKSKVSLCVCFSLSLQRVQCDVSRTHQDLQARVHTDHVVSWDPADTHSSPPPLPPPAPPPYRRSEEHTSELQSR